MRAAFLCSWNETRFLVPLAQIGRREGGFGAEMRKIVARISEELGIKEVLTAAVPHLGAVMW